MKVDELKLTQMVELHGCSCKLQERELERLLESSGVMVHEMGKVLMGPGDDAGGIRLSDDAAYITHLDFFTPIVDDPYLYGKIAACNAASDVFVKGAIDDIGILVIIAAPLEVPVEMLRQMLRGIRDFCVEVDAKILGGHTIINPWPIVGAAVIATTRPDKIIRNSTAKPGDILVLTKPLGIQPAMGALRALSQMRDDMLKVLPEKEIAAAANFAAGLMATPNKKAAEAMLEVGVNASTDVTGFGILGQSRIMARRSNVDIDIHTLPVIRGTPRLSSFFGYGLHEGKSAETSGGFLISVSRGRKDQLVSALQRRDVSAYEVGAVKKGKGDVSLPRDVRILEVSATA